MPWQCGMMLRFQFNNRVALSSCNRQVIQRHKEAKPVLKALLEEGKVLSVGPAGATGKSGVMQRSKYDGRPQTFEIKIRTPDDVTHIVEFRGLPFGLNNV